MQNNFGQRVKKHRVAAQLSQKQLAAKTGIRQSTISNIERGRNKGTKYIARLARALRVSPYELDTGKRDVLPIAAPDNVDNVGPGPALRGSVPLISWVQAGEWRSVLESLAVEENAETVRTTAPVNKFTFALRVRGDSMVSPTGPDSFPEGTIIIVEPELDPQPGDFVVVRQSGDETTFKRLVRDGDRHFLEPLNPRYPLVEMGKGCEICGVVREAVKRFR